MPKSKSKPFLIRIDRETLAALQRWAGDELRSLNGQIEWALRDELRRHGRVTKEQNHENSRH